MVDEIYHPGYAAKRMEIGAVVARGSGGKRAARDARARATCVVLLGRPHRPRRLRRRDRLLQIAHTRTLWKPAARRCRRATRPRNANCSACSAIPRPHGTIKRCNDFGAGGVSVAIGELADGLSIDLNAVPQASTTAWTAPNWPSANRRSAWPWCSRPKMWMRSWRWRDEENLEATRGCHGHGGKAPGDALERGSVIVDVSRDFLNSNGAPQAGGRRWCEAPERACGRTNRRSRTGLRAMAGDLNVCSRARPVRSALIPPTAR